MPQIHCPEERSKARKVENYQYTSALTRERMKLFRKIISVIQLSIYGAVSALCEEHKACQVRTERLVRKGQSDPLFQPAIDAGFRSHNELLVMSIWSGTNVRRICKMRSEQKEISGLEKIDWEDYS